MGVLAKFYAWLARHEKDVTVDLLGFSVADVRMDWTAVRRVDIGRQPTGHVEIFFVEMTGADGRQVVVDDLMDGFERFRAALLSQWPQYEAAWTRVFTGPPDIAERVTLFDEGR